MPAMNSYTLNLAFLYVALLCQVLISGTSIECWLRRDLPRRQRTTWLALSLAGSDADKRAYMLTRLDEAKASKVPGKQLQAWLEQAASEFVAAADTPKP